MQRPSARRAADEEAGLVPPPLPDEDDLAGEDDKYDHTGTVSSAGIFSNQHAIQTNTDGTAAALLGLGLLTRFYSLNWPREVVFDEFHFGKFVSGYITGGYFFDIHPPLSKLLLALFAYCGGYDGSQKFEKIGEAYALGGAHVFALRALPAIAGGLLVPLMFMLVREMDGSRPAAVLAAGIMLLDGAALVESRLLLTDSLLFLFEVAQLYGMVLVHNAEPRVRLSVSIRPLGRPSPSSQPTLPAHSESLDRDRAPQTPSFHRRLAFTGVAIGCAVSTKWTALATMAVVGLDTIGALLAELRTNFATQHARRPPATLHADGASCLAPFRSVAHSLGVRFVWLLLLPLTIYMLSFVAHLRLLPYSGPGDLFHDAPFRCRLLLRPIHVPAGQLPSLPRPRPECGGVHQLGMLDAIVALNRRMLSANAGIKRGHAFGSGWLMWPLNSKPVFYWKHDLPHAAGWCRIYMAGTPIAWLVCLSGLVLCALVLLARLVAKYWRKPLSMLMGGSRRGLGLGGTKPCWQTHRTNEELAFTRLSSSLGEGDVLPTGTSAVVPPSAVLPPTAALQARAGSADGSDAPLRRWGWLMVAGHLMAWLPFAMVTRVAFLYHYIPALLLSVLATALVFDALTPRTGHTRTAVAALLLLVIAHSSVYFLPLYLGWPLPPEEAQRRALQLDPWGHG